MFKGFIIKCAGDDEGRVQGETNPERLRRANSRGWSGDWGGLLLHLAVNYSSLRLVGVKMAMADEDDDSSPPEESWPYLKSVWDLRT